MNKLFAMNLLAVFAGCGLDKTAEPIPDGLVLDDNTAGHVSGTLGEDGVGIRFDFTGGATQLATITKADGTPLLDTQLENGVETSRFLDRLTLVGMHGQAEPTVDGDQTAYAELRAMPEGKLMVKLRDKLDQNGVKREMYAAPKPPKDAEQNWNATFLQCGQRIAVPTYSWWWPVYTAWHNTSYNYWDSYRINDGAITYYRADPPLPGGWLYYQSDYWSWWTVYWTNTCAYGPSQIWFDSQLL